MLLERDTYNTLAREFRIEGDPEGSFYGSDILSKDHPLASHGVAREGFTSGNKALHDIGYTAEMHGGTTQRLLDAGFTIVGHALTPEFGTSHWNMNAVHGETENPYDSEYTTAASSGGGAVAVATGLVDYMVGGDGAGSIRWPAAKAGLYGHLMSSGIGLQDRAGSGYDFGQLAGLTFDLARLPELYNVFRSDEARAAGFDFTAMMGARIGQQNILMSNGIVDQLEPGPRNREAQARFRDLFGEHGLDHVFMPERTPTHRFTQEEADAGRDAFNRQVALAASQTRALVQSIVGRTLDYRAGDIRPDNYLMAEGAEVLQLKQASDIDTLVTLAGMQAEHMREEGIDYIATPTLINPAEGGEPFLRKEHSFGAELVASLLPAIEEIKESGGKIDAATYRENFPEKGAWPNLLGLPSTAIPISFTTTENGKRFPVSMELTGQPHSDPTTMRLIVDADEILQHKDQVVRAHAVNGAVHYL